ncbi:MAG: hypothetical protein RQ714_06595 [Nitrosomonas sp.]|nr:hypothetical protein [Nitrosomonas sp.]
MAEPIIYTDPDEADQAFANDQLCRKIGHHLQKKYPGRTWLVEVVDHGRVCKIRCPQISMDYGMQFRIMERPEWRLKKAEMFAGEILERFNLTRGATDGSDVLALHRGVNGVIGAKHGDISANKPKMQSVIVDVNGRPMTGVKINAE